MLEGAEGAGRGAVVLEGAEGAGRGAVMLGGVEAARLDVAFAAVVVAGVEGIGPIVSPG